MATSGNFSKADRRALVFLIRDNEFNLIIENKKTDGLSTKKKKEMWGKIAKMNNAVTSSSQRTINQLKNCWKKLKQRAETEAANRCQQLRTTGGGPPPSDLSEITVLMRGEVAIISNHFL